MTPNATLPRERLESFCQRNGIRKLSLFGSVLRDDFGPDSDVDVLVEFEPDKRVGLIRLAGMELELAQILGRRVDMNTPRSLSPHFRSAVLAKSETQYERA
ncbi:MAG: nucleotidyltransferase family protein [Candidatus Sumerlaeaceae bacterium]|nr:nucleotidyltransferase family protein [Candidatus Sumerlaeaceae bacterium]